MTRGLGGRSPANIAHSLRGIDFPAGKRNLVEHAKGNGADKEVIDVLEQLPDREYGSMADVEKGVGKVE